MKYIVIIVIIHWCFFLTEDDQHYLENINSILCKYEKPGKTPSGVYFQSRHYRYSNKHMIRVKKSSVIKIDSEECPMKRRYSMFPYFSCTLFSSLAQTPASRSDLNLSLHLDQVTSSYSTSHHTNSSLGSPSFKSAAAAAASLWNALPLHLVSAPILSPCKSRLKTHIFECCNSLFIKVFFSLFLNYNFCVLYLIACPFVVAGYVILL